jgi:hypothetical protein
MFEAVGVVVSRLMRVRYGPFVLPSNLKRGQVSSLGEVMCRSCWPISAWTIRRPAVRHASRASALDVPCGLDIAE